jgi:hypothetical protein
MSIVLDGTTGLAGAATGALNGSLGATTPSTVAATDLTTTGNTILGNASTDTLNVGNGDLIKDASGNVGIGVTPDWAYGAGYKAIQLVNGGLTIASNGVTGNVEITSNAYRDAGSVYKYQTSTYATRNGMNSGEFTWYTAPSGTAGNAITFTQAMTLDASGSLTVNCSSGVANALVVQRNGGTDTNTVMQFKGATTSYYIGRKTDGSLGFAYNTADITSSSLMTLDAAGKLTIGADTSTNTAAKIKIVKFDNNATSTNLFTEFWINAGATASGAIAANGASAAAFVAYSDVSLKENIQDLPPQLHNILALRPVEFDYVESAGGGHQLGFIAQEVQAVYPDLVSGDADGLLMLSDLNKNDARLIKAIQELNAKFEEYKASHP